jgi:hypothetical protein
VLFRLPIPFRITLNPQFVLFRFFKPGLAQRRHIEGLLKGVLGNLQARHLAVDAIGLCINRLLLDHWSADHVTLYRFRAISAVWGRFDCQIRCRKSQIRDYPRIGRSKAQSLFSFLNHVQSHGIRISALFAVELLAIQCYLSDLCDLERRFAFFTDCCGLRML